jgi:hypothetical protein
VKRYAEHAEITQRTRSEEFFNAKFAKFAKDAK